MNRARIRQGGVMIKGEGFCCRGEIYHGLVTFCTVCEREYFLFFFFLFLNFIQGASFFFF